MAQKSKAYVDTSALIAFLDKSDTYHNVFARLFSSPPQLITSTLVIAEGHGWFLRRYDQNRALQFLNFIEELKPLTIEIVSTSEIKEAKAMLQKYHDQSLTLADALGLYLMQSKRIKSCWSTDRHLGLSGIPLVIYQ